MSGDRSETESDAQRSLPDLQRTVDTLLGSQRLGAFVLVGLLILAIFYTIYLARVFLLPVTLAVLFALLLSPLVRGLERLHFPRALASLVVLGVVVAGATWATAVLYEPAIEWIEKAPSNLHTVEARLRRIKQPVESVSKATEEVEKIARVDDSRDTRQVQIKEPGWRSVLIRKARHGALTGSVVFVLLYFLLASGNLFLRKLIRVLPNLHSRRTAVRIVQTLEGQVARYLLTITVINLVLGAAVAVTMRLLGMPNPILWGVLAALLNFVPYVGAIAGIAVLAFVAVLNFDPLWKAAIPPAAYFALTGAEGYFITPLILGRQLTLNAVAILVGLIFWTWLWGIAGALLAVPILVSFRVLCENIDFLRPLGEFLSRQ